ncbi:glycosyltransferase family 4 protein [Segetibacter aerophilus]|uniref:Glycosyl transferase family 1 domain-containing protein n=1 Tax=Segetibacter aerophilus TaxID=670293 RepID=A0A512B747_9BACT|nr:glycosyltransferase [Segetibacter aerophilus]GEO07617.1 hypothetical protein SAE01_01130 [Segetibacter aerophilus]
MTGKIKVYHFHNGSGGGVLSVISNLIQFQQHPEIENHVIYTINKDTIQSFNAPELPGVKSEQVFYYSPKWNFYYTCSQLARLLPDERGIIVAHDWLELGMVSNLGLNNPVAFFLHGNYEYYFDLAKKHLDVIDEFICISRPIYNKLTSFLKNRDTSIFLNHFPVPELDPIDKNNSILNIYFGVRSLTDANKQFLLLPKIDRLLRERGEIVRWTIIGAGGAENEVKEPLESLQNVTYYPKLPNNEILKLIASQDVFVLPSQNEGLPVALVEAMKAGVVPLITDWLGATEDLVINGVSGFYIALNDHGRYAAMISMLHNDRKLLRKVSSTASEIARLRFDPYKNTFDIEEHFITVAKEKKVKSAKKVYGSRLDNKYIPNSITTYFRHQSKGS